MRLRPVLAALAGPLALLVLLAIGYLTRSSWLPWLDRRPANMPQVTEEEHHHAHADRIKLTPQARANLKLVVDAVVSETYQRSVAIPGMVIDRPGLSDCGVTAPVAGVVTKISARPGDTVRAGESLFTLRLISEYVQSAQAELYKTERDLDINQEQRRRFRPVAKSGAIAEAALLDLEYQERRLKASALAHRQELLTRGLTSSQVDAVAQGRFVTEVTVVAPAQAAGASVLVQVSTSGKNKTGEAPRDIAFEVKDLKVQLGEQVQAGQALCLLSDHRALFIEGRAFEHEQELLWKAAQKAWFVRAEVAIEGGWQTLDEKLAIQYIANAVDPSSRTFPFYLPLANDPRPHVRDGQARLFWRFRPGQRVRLRVPVEEIEDAITLPAAAVVREGGEAYVFRQNGDYFERRPVHVVYEDFREVVLANDGSIGPGQFVAHNAAAALNRALKAQQAGGEGGHGHDHHGHSH